MAISRTGPASAPAVDRELAGLIEDDPHRVGADRARLVSSKTPVWALIARLHGVNGDLEQVATEYEVAVADVEAAVRYYGRHRDLIDARIAVNSAAGP